MTLTEWGRCPHHSPCHQWPSVTQCGMAGSQDLWLSPSAGPMPGPWRSFLHKMVRALGATLVSRLLLHTGQELILRGSYMSSSLEHLHSCKSGKMLVKVTLVIPLLSSAPFSPLHCVLSILKELHLSHIRYCPSLCNSKVASTADSEMWHAAAKWGRSTVEVNFCLSSFKPLYFWWVNYVMKLVYSPYEAQYARTYWWLLILQEFERIWKDCWILIWEDCFKNVCMYHSKG